MADSITHEFALQNTAQSLITSLKEILLFIDGHLPGYAAKETINFKSQFIITELLTNAIKHAGDTEIAFRVFISDECITIEKHDNGNPFSPKSHPLLLNNNAGFKGQISKDAIHTIYAIVESKNVVRFVCEENDYTTSDLNAIGEHFGLLIITKSAESFTYRYDKELKLNTFKVELKLR